MMSQPSQDLDDGETRHDNGKLKLTNVTKCSGRSTPQGASRKLNSQTSRVEEVCLKNACINDVHMTIMTTIITMTTYTTQPQGLALWVAHHRG